MSSHPPNDLILAACLTPPSAGGIAVIQVIGRAAGSVVNPLLAAKHPIDVAAMRPDELRLGRILDRGETLDDVIVAARRHADGALVVDLSVHGGTRVVQRVLLALAAAGATLVEADTLAQRGSAPQNLLEQEALEILLHAKTRPVATWLARAPAALLAAAMHIDRLIAERQTEAARRELKTLSERFTQSRYLIQGVRVVLTGAPNSGKSTLANALAGTEHSIVSPTAGTTRDWVELPAAFDGLPVTLVDTAGIAPTADVLEQESIRRAREQLATADFVLHVLDRSAPLPTDAGVQGRPPSARALRVWNKCDLPPHPGHETIGTEVDVRVSGQTGEGLAELRRRVLMAVGLTDWSGILARPFTERQDQALQTSLSALETGQFPGSAAHNLLTASAQPMNSSGETR